MKKTHREKVFILVVNKLSIGGVETLTKDLDAELRNSNVKSEIFEIASNSFLSYLFKRKLLRVGVLLLAIPRLALLVGYNDLARQRNCIVIFQHAECHILSRLLPFPNHLAPNANSIISLFQSPQIYPAKLLNKAVGGFGKVSGIFCYSSTVMKGWSELSTVKITPLPLAVKIENIPIIDFIPTTENPIHHLRIVHVGRNTPWKRPEEAVRFALQIIEMGIKVDLHFVGIEKLNNISHYLEYPNLKIKFHGMVKEVEEYLLSSDILVNLFDCSKALESIGITALEALKFGKVVVIEDIKETSFSNLKGIYERNEILNLISKNLLQSRHPLHLITINEIDYKKNLEKISISTYAKNLMKAANEFSTNY